jgi:hypothetical protein
MQAAGLSAQAALILRSYGTDAYGNHSTSNLQASISDSIAASCHPAYR